MTPWENRPGARKKGLAPEAPEGSASSPFPDCQGRRQVARRGGRSTRELGKTNEESVEEKRIRQKKGGNEG